MPLALLMSYPAPYVSPKKFVPSLLLSLDDILLPSKFLQFALSAYTQGVELDAATNELMSPLIAPAETLSQFPQTMI